MASCYYEYRNKKTDEKFKLEDLQNKYGLGFGQRELWDIIERDYVTEIIYSKEPRVEKEREL